MHPFKRQRSSSFNDLPSLNLSELAASLDMDTPSEESLLLQIDAWPDLPCENKQLVKQDPIQEKSIQEKSVQEQSKQRKNTCEKFTQTEVIPCVDQSTQTEEIQEIEDGTQTCIEIRNQTQQTSSSWLEKEIEVVFQKDMVGAERKEKEENVEKEKKIQSKVEEKVQVEQKVEEEKQVELKQPLARRQSSPSPVKLWSSIKRLWGSIVPGEDHPPKKKGKEEERPRSHSIDKNANYRRKDAQVQVQEEVQRSRPSKRNPSFSSTTAIQQPKPPPQPQPQTQPQQQQRQISIQKVGFHPSLQPDSQRQVTPIYQPQPSHTMYTTPVGTPKMSLTLNLKPKLEHDVTDEFEYDLDDEDLPASTFPSDDQVTGLCHTFSSPILTISPMTPVTPQSPRLPPAMGMSSSRRQSLSPVEKRKPISFGTRSQPTSPSPRRKIGTELDRRVAQLRELRNQLREHRSTRMNTNCSKVVTLPRPQTLSALDGLKQRKREALIERQKKLTSSLRVPRVGSVPRNVKLPNPSPALPRRSWRNTLRSVQRKQPTSLTVMNTSSRQTQNNLPSRMLRSNTLQRPIFRRSPTRIKDTNAHM